MSGQVVDEDITAVIPTYRRPQLLRRAVESALGQTRPGVRVLILDNSSGDETEEVAAELVSRSSCVTYVCHERNIGAPANFQAGLDRVETPYFSFLSDDDLLLPGFYEHALGLLHGSPQAGFFCGQVVIHDPEDGSHVLNPRKGWREGFYGAGEAVVPMVRHLFTWTGCVFATEVARAAGPLARSGMVDLLFMARAASLSAFVVSLRPCAIFTSWQQGAFHATTGEEMADSFRQVRSELARLPHLPRREAEEVERYLSTKSIAVAGRRLKRAFVAGDWEAFDRLSSYLEGERLSLGKRLHLTLGGLRRRHPHLVSGARGLLARRQVRQRRRRSGGRLMTVEDLVALYGPGLKSG